MRKRLLAALLLAAGVGITALWLDSARAPVPDPEKTAPPPAPPAAEKSIPPPTLALPEPLPPAALAEAQHCIPGSYSSMDELAAWAIGRAGQIKEETVEWRVAQFADPATSALYRLVLETERSQSGRPSIKLKLFSVDKENLPDPLPLPSGLEAGMQGFDSFLHGKRLVSDLESRVFEFADGRELRWEKENGRSKEIDFSEGANRLRCSTAYSEASCHCSPARHESR